MTTIGDYLRLKQSLTAYCHIPQNANIKQPIIIKLNHSMSEPNFERKLNTYQSEIFKKVSQQGGLKHSMVLTKNVNPTLSFTNKSNHSLTARLNPMSQSCIRKQSTDIDSFIKEVKERFFKIDKTLYDHDREINDLRDKSTTNSFYSTSDSFFKNQSFNNQLYRSMRKQFQEDSCRLKNNIYSEIDALKNELRNQCVNKTQLTFLFGKFQNNISSLVQNTNLTQEINNIKHKMKTQFDSVQSFFSQQLTRKINELHETTTKSVAELKYLVDGLRQQFKPSYQSSNQKCYSPKLIKYKEIVQKLPSNSYEKIGEEIVVNEVVYYVDRDGYLLDSNFYYLLDKNNKQIQLDSGMIRILNSHELLK